MIFMARDSTEVGRSPCGERGLKCCHMECEAYIA